MTIRLLTDSQRVKEDDSNDLLFYSSPRFVHHLDGGFRKRLTALYKQHLTEDSIVLDLMSSWVSHLPSEFKFKKVIGHGLNENELKSNTALSNFWIQDFNKNHTLPLEDSSIDYCLMVAAWQYLQYPEDIAFELKRVVRPKGKLIISFSNRAFWSKTPRIWLEASNEDRVKIVSSILLAQGWSQFECVQESFPRKGLLRALGSSTDPFFSLIAIN